MPGTPGAEATFPMLLPYPAKYCGFDTSDLKAEVTRGGSNDFVFELKDGN